MRPNQGELGMSGWGKLCFESHGEPQRVFEQERAYSPAAEPIGNIWLINLGREVIIAYEVVTLATCWGD